MNANFKKIIDFKGVLMMEKIYCMVENCVFHKDGFCSQDDLRITMVNGVPKCFDYYPSKSSVPSTNKTLAKGILDEIKKIYADMYDAADLATDFEVDLTKCELCTDKTGTCFILEEGSNYLQDFACDERIAALIDARNVIIGGKPSTVTFKE